MASSKVMASTSPANPDLPRQSSILSSTVPELQSDQSRAFGSMNMDELLKNMYADSDSFPSSAAADNGCSAASSAVVDGGGAGVKNVSAKSVDEVWREIVGGSGGGRGTGNREPEMTLEDFLTKAGAMREEDVGLPVIPPPPAGYGVDSMMNGAQFPHMQSSHNGVAGFGVDSLGFANGIDGRLVAGGTCGSGAGRGKRRALEQPPVDKATQQKQRRMIKNRESAARSRERKQAYTVELEALVIQLEEENSRLLREEAENNKKRFKKLMVNLIPVVETRRPQRSLRRVNSMCW